MLVRLFKRNGKIFGMLFGKPKSYLGVDLGAGGVKIVELRQEKQRPVLFTYGFTSESEQIHSFWTHLTAVTAPAALAPKPGMEKAAPHQALPDSSVLEGYAATVRAVCESAKTVAKRAVVSLPVSAVFHAFVTVPKVPRKEFELVLKTEVKKLLPYPLEDASLDYQVLTGPDPHMERVLVNAVPRALVGFYTQVFSRAGLTLEALETEATALARSLVGRDTAIILVVDIGAERTNFFVIDGAVPVTHQSLEVGGAKINDLLGRTWGLTGEAVEQLKQDLFISLMNPEARRAPLWSRDEFLELFLPLFEPIIKEIEDGLNLYLRQSGSRGRRPEKIILTGGACRFPYLTDYLAEKLKLKCYIGDPWGRVVYQEGLRRLLQEIGPRLSVAIGLALRSMV